MKKQSVEPKCKNCVSGDTLILVDGKISRIDEAIYASRTFVNNKWHSICGWTYSGKRQVVKIKTTLGLELKVTPDHLISTPNGWKEAGNLKINEQITTIKNLTSFGTENLIDAKDALLMGAITGDGWICNYKKKNKSLIGIGFGFSAERYDAWKPMLEYAAVRFKSREKVHLLKRAKNPFLRIDWRNSKAEEFQKLFTKKQIPEVIWKSSQNIWGAYLSGLFSTDGCLDYNKNEQIRVLFFQAQEQLIREVQIMLRLMGIYSYLNFRERKPYKTLWSLTVGRINSIELFHKKVGFVDQERQIKLNSAITYARKPKIGGRWKVRRKVNEIERVKRIEETGEMDVYDICVPKTESFYANGILVHNCLLYDRKNGTCKVAVLIEGKEFHLPVFPEDHCHMDELGIPVEQVRWYVEDPATGKPTDGDGIVKMEYPEDFFGERLERKN